jgi:hypothetical protein
MGPYRFRRAAFSNTVRQISSNAGRAELSKVEWAQTAMRAGSFRRRHLIERTADAIFITAMVVMTVICGFITYAMSISPNASH